MKQNMGAVFMNFMGSIMNKQQPFRREPSVPEIELEKDRVKDTVAGQCTAIQPLPLMPRNPGNTEAANTTSLVTLTPPSHTPQNVIAPTPPTVPGPSNTSRTVITMEAEDTAAQNVTGVGPAKKLGKNHKPPMSITDLEECMKKLRAGDTVVVDAGKPGPGMKRPAATHSTPNAKRLSLIHI